MSNTKIHIDQLFAKGLENLELPVFSSDFEKVKAELPVTATPQAPFENFELPVTDQDWKGIKERLEKAPSRTVVLLPTEYAKDAFKDFEIAVTDADWMATKNKLEASSKKKMVWWWWLNMVIVGLVLGALVHYFSPLQSTPVASQAEIKNKLVAQAPMVAPSTQNANPTVVTTEEAKAPTLKENTTSTAPLAKPSKHVPQGSGQSTIATKPEVEHLTADYTSHHTPLTTTPTNNEPIEVSSTSNTNPIADPIKTEKVSEYSPSNSIKNILDHIEINAVSKPTENNSGSSKTTEISINNSSEPVLPGLPSMDTSKKETPKNTSTPPPPPPHILPQFYVGLVTDFDRTYRHLSGNNPSAYNNIRNNADKAIMQFSYGFVAGMQKARNQFQIGAQMTSQNFNSNYNYVLQIQDSIPVYDPFGVLVGKYPFGKKRDTTISGSTHMVVKKVNIPFTYNRFWKLDSKTELMTGVNGIIGINVKSSGDFMLNPANNQLYHFNYLKKAQNTLAFSPGISIGIQRKFGTSFLLQTNLAAAYTVTNRYDKDFTAKQYPYSTKGSAFNAQEHLYNYGLSIKLLYLLH